MDSVVVPLGHSASIDVMDCLLSRLPQAETVVGHVFTPGLYSRSLKVPAGTLATTKIHRTKHQWVLLRGSVSMWTEESGWNRIDAPAMGVTEAGTRRVGYVHEDAEWVTFHATEADTPEAVEAEIIEPHEPGEPRLPEDVARLLAEIQA